MADIDTFKLETIRIDGNANIRSAPDDGASILFKTGSPSPALSVGTKDGDWIAWWIEDRKRWGYTSISANVLSREPYQNTVEVPDPVLKAELDAALGQIGAMTTRIRLKDEHHATYPKG